MPRKKRKLSTTKKLELEHAVFTKIEGYLPILRFHVHELWRQLWVASHPANDRHTLLVGKASDIKDDTQRLTDLFSGYLRPPRPKTPKTDVVNHYYILRLHKGEYVRIRKEFKHTENEVRLREKWKQIDWDNPKERKLALQRLRRFVDGGADAFHNAFLEEFFKEINK